MSKKDRRYTITAEFTGDISAKRQYVVRFCDKYIADFSVKHDAEMYVHELKEKGTEYTLKLIK